MSPYVLSAVLLCLLYPFQMAATSPVDSGTPHNESDPWFLQHRTAERERSTMVSKEGGEPIKFFNGLSVGANLGVGLFHGDLADYKHLAPLRDFSTYYQFGWRAYVQRDIKWGLGAQLHFEAGSLGGGRIQGKQSPKINFRSEYRTLALVGTFDVLGELFRKDKSKESKVFLLAEAGIGLTWFRAYTTWTGDDERVRDFVGYSVTDANPPTQRYVLDGLEPMAMALNIPVGFTFGYRVNYKTDVTFSYMLNNVFTNELDAKSLDWTANDKYSYFGVGLRYNFNRDEDDYPKKKKKKKEDKDTALEADKNKKWRLFGSDKEDVSPKEVKLDGPIESRLGNRVDPEEENKELEEVRMKMFELQLKLFEMQYLLGGGSKKEP